VPLPSAAGTVLGIEPAAEDVAGPSRSGRGKGCTRLHGAEEPPASPWTHARSPLRQLVVVPRTPTLQAAEDALSMALLALVLGTRPPVTPALLLQHLYDHYGVSEDRVTVWRTRPDDFIVWFSNQDDLQRVLDIQRPEGAAFTLRWRRWSRLILGSASAFRYRCLVGMKGLPSHARSTEVVQCILGSAGAKAEIANPEAVADPDDERERFVASWCAHPDLVPDEIIMAVLELEEDHDGGSPLYL